MADAHFATLKQIENPQPGSVGKRAKNRVSSRWSGFDFHIRLGKYISFGQAVKGV